LALKIPPAKANADFEACAAPTGIQGKVYSKLVNAAYGTYSMPNLRPVPPNAPKTKNISRRRQEMLKMPKNVVVVSQPRRSRSRYRNGGGASSEMVLAPASVGHMVGGGPPRPSFSRNGESVTVSGQEVIISLALANQSTNFELVGGHRFNPNYFMGSRMSYYSQLFEEYKFENIELTYITASSSATNGDVLLTYEEDPNISARDPTNSNFVTRALSKRGSVLCSVWKDFTTTLNISKEWKYSSVDDIIDPRTAIAGDAFIYSRGTITQPGYVMCRYTATFRKPIFDPKSYALGTWADWSISAVTQAANPTVGRTVVLSFSGLTTATGQIFKFIICYQTLGTGVTTANTWQLSENGSNVAITVASGATFYGVIGAGGAFYVYPTLSQAKSSPATNVSNANVSDSIIVGTANTSTSTFYIATCQLNLDPALLVSAQ